MPIQTSLQTRSAFFIVMLQAILALCSQDCVAQGTDTRFVRANAPAGGNGTSWASAYNNIKTALTAANSNQSIKKIWVAEGTYFPGTTRFALKNNLALYGGFEGNETQLAQRNIALNETILTGQGTNAIINGGTTNETAIVDGFTIRDGFTTQENGGAVLNGSSTFRNCRFIDNFSANSGGAWYGDTGTPRFIACEFTGNECGAGGAAIETVNGSFTVVGCRFTGNTAPFFVIYSLSGSVTVVNSLIAGNNAGGIFANQGPATVRNSTIAANSGQVSSSTAIRSNGTITIQNSIIWQNGIEGNFTASNSCLPVSAPGNGNISVNPRFVSPSQGNWRVASNSPTIDAGSVALLPTDAFDLDGDGDTAEQLPVDLQGGARRSDEPAVVDTGVGPAPVVDMGAYEFVRDCNGNGIVDSADIANGTSADTDGNGVPDECEDCNNNQIPDGVEIANGTSTDCQKDGVPDECQLGVGPTVISAVDDGVAEDSVGNNALGNFIWLNAFQVETGGEILRAVELAFGDGIPEGDPVTVHVWTDPTNDGNPADAVRR
ncbi:MAG: right-handed parallel beta-helix repeat-containing protein, partial [Planctomycetota bacterium]|nr:right-handed parallel beta-helix repeat-containing protein [Planctomycetota bacterium]